MRLGTTTLAALLLVVPQTGPAQIKGPKTPAGCLGVAVDSEVRLTARGRLTLQTFPGPPNYESIERGDSGERAFILELSRVECVERAEDESEIVMTVHVAASNAAVRRTLHGALGRMVTVSGEGFLSHTGHHHAAIVLMADQVNTR